MRRHEQCLGVRVFKSMLYGLNNHERSSAGKTKLNV